MKTIMLDALISRLLEDEAGSELRILCRTLVSLFSMPPPKARGIFYAKALHGGVVHRLDCFAESLPVNHLQFRAHIFCRAYTVGRCYKTLG